MEEALLPDPPQPPQVPAPFFGMDPELAAARLREDRARYVRLCAARPQLLFFLPAALLLLGGLGLIWVGETLFGIGSLLAALVLTVMGYGKKQALIRERTALKEKYGTPNPEDWQHLLEDWQEAIKTYEIALLDHRVGRGDLDIRMTFLKKQRASLCGEQDPDSVTAIWQEMMDKWEDYYTACREAKRAENYWKTLRAMEKPAEKPEFSDALTYSAEDTDRLTAEALAEQQRLMSRIGQYQGRMAVLGDGAALEQQLLRQNERIGQLEQTYAAVALSLDTLDRARKELQRRFAPGITRRAQELLSRMTLGRYQHLSLGEDLGLHAGAGEEDTLREALWRSDGTVDQLYLALRLAVAEELTPDAPLVLDDALVRFDDDRLKAALEVLKEIAKEKQVILFTCQSREQAMTR